MGFFSKLFGTETSEVRRLRECYVPVLQKFGFTMTEANSWFDDMLQQITMDCRNSGADQMPPNFGDYLLEHESSDPQIGKKLRAKRSDGVRDSDIRWWWNMSVVERGLLMKMDEVAHTALFLQKKEEEKTAEEAAKILWKFHPQFGDPEQGEEVSQEDRPIPFELKKRVAAFTEERMARDAAQFAKEIESCSSFNALVRSAIAKGQF